MYSDFSGASTAITRKPTALRKKQLKVSAFLFTFFPSITLTCEALQNKQKSLIDVVESLGEYINDEDNASRARTIEYLSQVIGSLPPTFLSRQQIQVLCQFLCDRIEDGGSIGGLKKLHAMERYNGEMATMTFRA